MNIIPDDNKTVDLTPRSPRVINRRQHYFPDPNAPEPEELYDDYEADYPSEPKSRAPMIIAVSAAVIVVLVAAILFTYIFLFASDNTAEPVSTTAPTEETTMDSSTQPLTLTPAARTVTMPDLSGLSEEAAYQRLNESGVKYKITRQFSEEVERGYVITQTPDPYTEFTRTEEAMVYLSKGRKDDIVESTTKPKPKETEPTEATSATKATSPVSSGKYILPNSNSKYLSKSDLKGLDRTELNLALNEIFARHGRIFSDPEIKAYFASQSWYHGTVSASDFSMGVLNEYESYNLDLITEYQSELGYR